MSWEGNTHLKRLFKNERYTVPADVVAIWEDQVARGNQSEEQKQKLKDGLALVRRDRRSLSPEGQDLVLLRRRRRF